MSRKNKPNIPSNHHDSGHSAEIEALSTQLAARIRGFEQEKSSMLCTIACLVHRLGDHVIVGQQDAEFINLWLANKVQLSISQHEVIIGHTVFEFVVTIAEDASKPV